MSAMQQEELAGVNVTKLFLRHWYSVK